MKRYDAEHLSAIDVVDRLIRLAIEAKASDIHLEPAEAELQIRFRIDGILQKQSSLPLKIQSQILSRLKILAHIDIAESRLPQDGKIRFETASDNIDLRVSTFPSIYGQKIVIRILNRDYHFLHFDQLGFDSGTYDIIKNIINKPQGLFIVTGPTGSGKTTTLYALLSYLNNPERNIITLEDPVEYDIEGITQGYISERIGFSFAQGIRSILRQDPDIIMVGEIRDEETAQTAIHAALTGHLVLTTLHTNDAPSAIIRLVNMGIAPYLVNAALSGVLAQRLVRTLCECKNKRKATEDEQCLLKGLGLKRRMVYEAQGCSQCNTVGYQSRIGLFECMPMNDKLRMLIEGKLQLDLLRKEAVASGMYTLQEQARKLLFDGIISLEEYLRVI